MKGYTREKIWMVAVQRGPEGSEPSHDSEKGWCRQLREEECDQLFLEAEYSYSSTDLRQL